MKLRVTLLWMYTLVFIFLSTGNSVAESDGEEFLGLLNNKSTIEVARAHVDDVWRKWNGTLFCITVEGAEETSQVALSAVKLYLEDNPSELFRPRRYLIIQGLREGFACN